VQSLSIVQERRAASIWTKIHPVFAIAQLLVFLVSLLLLGLYALHAVPFHAVHVSVLVKVALMLGAIVTGALWERDVFGWWWFAPDYLVEDATTVMVVALHVAYLVLVYFWPANTHAIVAMLCVAYTVYAINVAHYIIRNRQMRAFAERSASAEEIAA